MFRSTTSPYAAFSRASTWNSSELVFCEEPKLLGVGLRANSSRWLFDLEPLKVRRLLWIASLLSYTPSRSDFHHSSYKGTDPAAESVSCTSDAAQRDPKP